MAVDTEEMRRLVKKLDVIAWRDAILEEAAEIDELRLQLAHAKRQLRDLNLQQLFDR